MNLPSLLYRHYHAAHAAYALTDCACCQDEHAADKRAVDCAALHVAIDAMSRIARKRTPKHAGYAPLPDIDPQFIALSLVRPMLRHRAALHAAWERADDYATLAPIGRAQAVADHYARRL